MLANSIQHQLDAKFRLRLPAKVRDSMGRFVIVRGINGCLFVFNKEHFEEHYGKKLQAIPTYNSKFHRAKLSITSLYDEPESDAQGRFVLLANFRKYAAIEKNVVIAGGVDHLEIWAEERYEKFLNGTLELTEEHESFNSLMTELEGFGL